jgi:hypothetical protein
MTAHFLWDEKSRKISLNWNNTLVQKYFKYYSSYNYYDGEVSLTLPHILVSSLHSSKKKFPYQCKLHLPLKSSPV